MSDWTGSERQRRPQGGCECPPNFRGSQRYVSNDDCNLPTRMPFGKFKGVSIYKIDTSYLRWLTTIDTQAD